MPAAAVPPGRGDCEPSPLRGRRLDLDVQETTIFDWQDWLRDQVIAKIPHPRTPISAQSLGRHEIATVQTTSIDREAGLVRLTNHLS